IERDVERAGRHLVAVDVLQRAREPTGERDASGADADEGELVESAISFEDFVGNARERARHAVGIHYERHGCLRSGVVIGSLFSASRGRVKEFKASYHTGPPGGGRSTCGVRGATCGATCDVRRAVRRARCCAKCGALCEVRGAAPSARHLARRTLARHLAPRTTAPRTPPKRRSRAGGPYR